MRRHQRWRQAAAAMTMTMTMTMAMAMAMAAMRRLHAGLRRPESIPAPLKLPLHRKSPA